MTKKIILIGHPVKHSLSPLMHNAGFKELKLDYQYELLDVIEHDLEKTILRIRNKEFFGANVTIPYKEKVIPFLDSLTDEAKKIGAVNTIISKDNKLIGDNTDGRGFLRSLKEDLKLNLENESIFIFGAGGASRAILVSLLKENPKEIFLNDLICQKAENLSKLDKRVKPVDSSLIESCIKQSKLLINTTPSGMNVNDNFMAIPSEFLTNDKYVYDIVYNRETALIKFCKNNGIKCINGLEMLLYQGVLGFEAWTGKSAPVEVMRKALMERR
jgi:shikimate dehydrogenase